MFTSKQKKYSRKPQKSPRAKSKNSLHSRKGDNEFCSSEDDLCWSIGHSSRNLNSEATKFLTNLRGKAAKKGSDKKKSKKRKKGPEVTSPTASQSAAVSSNIISTSPQSGHSQSSPKRLSSAVHSPVHYSKRPQSATLRETDLTPPHFPMKVDVPSTRSNSQSDFQFDFESLSPLELNEPYEFGVSPKKTETSPSSHTSPANSPQLSPTVFSSPQSSPTLVRSPVMQSGRQRQATQDKLSENDSRLDVLRRSARILTEKIDLDLEERCELNVNLEELGSPSPIMMSPPVPSPHYSFIDAPSPPDSPLCNVSQNQTPPQWESPVNHSPLTSEEESCSPAVAVGNQSEPPAVENSKIKVQSEGDSMTVQLSSGASAQAGTKSSGGGGGDITCARNLQSTAEFCGKKTDKTKSKSKKPTIDLNLGLFERLKAKRLGLKESNDQLSDAENLSSAEDESTTLHGHSQGPQTNQNTEDSICAQLEFHDDGGFNCDIGILGTFEEFPEQDKEARTQAVVEMQPTVMFDSLNKFGGNKEMRDGAVTGDGKHMRVDRKDKTGRTGVMGKKPRSQQVGSENEDKLSGKSEKGRRGTESSKECQKSGKGGKERAKTAMTPMPKYNTMVTPDLKVSEHF